MLIAVRRHELPVEEFWFTIQAYGFKPLSLQMENDIPVMYEIGITSPEDDKPWPHRFIWLLTGSQLPDGIGADSFVGTVQFLDGQVMHLFQDWRS
jgi:hypothetical protein